MSEKENKKEIKIVPGEKAKQRQWLFNPDTMIISTREGEFDLNNLTSEGMLFVTAYGAKQFLSDKVSAMGGSEFSDVERFKAMADKYDMLIDEKYKIMYTETGFRFKDPDAVATKRGGIKQADLYNYFIEHGHTAEEATKAVNTIKGQI